MQVEIEAGGSRPAYVETTRTAYRSSHARARLVSGNLKLSEKDEA
jgi:hypothetical protein